MKFILGGIGIFLWGCFMAFKPSTFWEYFESWKNAGNSTPSKFYLIQIQIGGGICMFAGLAVLIASFFIT